MIVDEFLVRLERTPRRWVIRRGGTIRLRYPWWQFKRGLMHCPLSAVANTRPCEVSEARDALGLDRYAAWEIANAADGNHTNLPSTAELRERIIKACGLRV